MRIGYSPLYIIMNSCFLAISNNSCCVCLLPQCMSATLTIDLGRLGGHSIPTDLNLVFLYIVDWFSNQ